MGTFEAGWDLYLKKNFAEAHTVFWSVAHNTPDGDAQNRALDASLFMLTKLPDGAERVRAALSALEGALSECSAAGIYRAGVALFEKRLDDFYAACEELPAYDPQRFGPWNRGLNSIPSAAQRHRFDALCKDKEAMAESNTAAQHVLLFAADTVYFEKFAELCTRSYRETGGENPMHFIVMQPSDEARRIADHIHGQDEQCTFSFEQATYPTKAYFASRRYLAAIDLLETMQRPVAVFDIDLRFKISLPELLKREAYDPQSVLVRRSPLYTLPWQHITVNAMCLPYNRNGRKFARYMAAFLRETFAQKPDTELWWIDQNAALFAYLATGEGAFDNLRVRDFLALPELFADRLTSIRK